MSFEITLSQSELDKAIKNHVKTLGLNVEGKTITVDFTTTRKPAGYSALVTISDSIEKSCATAVVPIKAVKPEIEHVYADPAPTLYEAEEVNLPPITPETPVSSNKSIFDQE